jgi:NTE family protein
MLTLFLLPALQAAGNEPDSTGTQSVIIRPLFGDASEHVPAIVPLRHVVLPRLGLVLSGGGARGVSSVGVLKAFEKYNLPVDLIIGTSIGSIVGGLYASGYSPGDLERLVDTTDWVDVLNYSDEARREEMFLEQRIANERSMLVLRFKGLEPVIPSSYSSGQHLTNYLNILALQGIYHPNPSFNDLRIPFRAVTTDLVSGRQFVFDRGDLSQAMRASVSVPLLFSPVARDSMQLLDGGLLSNMPVEIARANGADIVVSVDVTSPLRPPDKLNAPWEIAEQIMGVMMQKQNEEARRKSDVVIQPALGEHLSTDFTGLEELVHKGEEAVDSSVDTIRRLLKSKTDHWFSARSPRSYPHVAIVCDRNQLSG